LLNVYHADICLGKLIGFLADGITGGDFDNIFKESVSFSLMFSDFESAGLVDCFT